MHTVCCLALLAGEDEDSERIKGGPISRNCCFEDSVKLMYATTSERDFVPSGWMILDFRV